MFKVYEKDKGYYYGYYFGVFGHIMFSSLQACERSEEQETLQLLLQMVKKEAYKNTPLL